MKLVLLFTTLGTSYAYTANDYMAYFDAKYSKKEPTVVEQPVVEESKNVAAEPKLVIPPPVAQAQAQAQAQAPVGGPEIPRPFVAAPIATIRPRIPGSFAAPITTMQPAVQGSVATTPVVNVPVVNVPAFNAPVVNVPVTTPVVNAPTFNAPTVNTPTFNVPTVNAPVANTPGFNGPIVDTTVVEGTDVQPLNGWIPNESLPCYGLPGAIPPAGFFDPLHLSKDLNLCGVKRYREAEIMHGRVSMLATVGYLIAESTPTIAYGMNTEHANANTQITEISGAYLVPFFIFINILETYRAKIGWAEPGEGSFTLRDDYYPGDIGFDLLGLKPKNPKEFEVMQCKELSHGRLATLAIAGMIWQEQVNGKGILENLGF